MKLINWECLEEMKQIPDGSVDLILTDPPYGTMKWAEGTNIYGDKNNPKHNWDIEINPKDIFKEANRILRKNWKLVLFSQEPYTSKLITEAIPNVTFGYRLTWLKDSFAFALWCKKSPVNFIEDILVFSKNNPKNEIYEHPLRDYFKKQREKIKHITYKEINKECFGTASNGGGMASNVLTSYKKWWTFPTKEKYQALQKLGICSKNYEELKEIDEEYKLNMHKEQNILFPSVFNLPEWAKYKSNVLEYKKDYTWLHPTQKPVALMEDLIKTYTNEWDLVLDFTAWSGSTLVACKNTNRQGIWIELDKDYFEIMKERLK